MHAVVEGAARIEAELGVERVGPSLWGTVYRALELSRYYRLIPSNASITAERKAELDELVNRPRRPRVAPVAEVGQRGFGDHWYVVVRYDIGAEATLTEILASGGPADRVRAVGATLGQIPGWWQSVGPGSIPMPSDVVFVGGTPFLLAMPPWGAPGIDAFLAEPARAHHIAPEVARGLADRPGGSADLFSVGIMLLLGLVTLPDGDAGRMLHRAACGVTFAWDRPKSRLPFWLQNTRAVQQALQVARGLTDPDPCVRGALDPAELARRLACCPSAMDPVTAVRELSETGRPQEAMELAQAILLDGPSYDILLLAAGIAWRDLGKPLVGLSLLDQAVSIDANRTAAYAEQVKLISDLRTDIVAQLAAAIDASFAERLDRTMETAFRHLPETDQNAQAADLAWYLIERGHLAQANELAYHRLHEGQTELWWRFDLMLAYGETFLRLDRLEEAKQVAERIRTGLRRVRINQTMSEAEVRRFGHQLTEFELRIYEHRRTGAAR